MQANELRIGNHVMIENEQHEHVKGAFMRVKGIEKIHMSQKEKEWFPNSNSSISVVCVSGDFMYSIFNQYNQFIKPIALTEEILLKIKGIKQEGLTFRIGKYILWYYNGESYAFMLYNEKDDRPDDLKVYSIELTKVKYLHQLQNVFYSLENEELEINL